MDRKGTAWLDQAQWCPGQNKIQSESVGQDRFMQNKTVVVWEQASKSPSRTHITRLSQFKNTIK